MLHPFLDQLIVMLLHGIDSRWWLSHRRQLDVLETRCLEVLQYESLQSASIDVFFVEMTLIGVFLHLSYMLLCVCLGQDRAHVQRVLLHERD